MSLSRWLKAYLYIPLGGNRNATFGTYFWIVLFSIIALILSGSWIVSTLMAVLGLSMVLLAKYRASSRKMLFSNINRFITMLFGGMWHGASWNFIIWGGLNGIGMIIYIIWKELSSQTRLILTFWLTLLLLILSSVINEPVLNILYVWSSIICIGTIVRHLWKKYSNGKFIGFEGTAGTIWGVVQTFTFITFTRLFFRCGSNLDPATANEVAWETAKNMMCQIGTAWNTSIIPAVCLEYWKVFALVIAGLVIHWLPVRVKKWYRITFASLPVPVIAALAVLVVIVVYQFVCADTQPFIYFQF